MFLSFNLNFFEKSINFNLNFSREIDRYLTIRTDTNSFNDLFGVRYVWQYSPKCLIAKADKGLWRRSTKKNAQQTITTATHIHVRCNGVHDFFSFFVHKYFFSRFFIVLLPLCVVFLFYFYFFFVCNVFKSIYSFPSICDHFEVCKKQ